MWSNHAAALNRPSGFIPTKLEANARSIATQSLAFTLFQNTFSNPSPPVDPAKVVAGRALFKVQASRQGSRRSGRHRTSMRMTVILSHVRCSSPSSAQSDGLKPFGCFMQICREETALKRSGSATDNILPKIGSTLAAAEEASASWRAP